MTNLQDRFEEIKNKIDQKIENHFLKLEGIDEKLLDAMKYSLFSGGKRLRPCILVAFYELFGGKSEKIYDVSLSLEMMHSFSLVHDDLPCMDGSEYRRGKKCTHIVFGEAMALLAGDALVMQAFDVLMRDEILFQFGEKSILQALTLLSESSGAKGMINGQSMEINFKNDESFLLDIYEKKTGMLFSASATIGAICAKADEKNIFLAREYGKTFGIAFQLCDDITDLSEDKEGITYAKLLGKEKTIEKINEYICKLYSISDKIDPEDEVLSWLVSKLKF